MSVPDGRDFCRPNEILIQMRHRDMQEGIYERGTEMVNILNLETQN